MNRLILRSKEFMRDLRRSVSGYLKRYHSLVAKYPGVIVPFFLLYLLTSLFWIAAALSIWVLLSEVFQIDETVAEALFYLTAFALLVLNWSHYLFLAFIGFRRSFVVKGDVEAVLRLVQTLAVVTFVFALLYYFLQLLTDNGAFAGMAPINVEYGNWNPRLEDQLTTIPPFETLVDCLYFSVVTITTLGYGDIQPLTPAAKLLTTLEVALGFSLTVLALGSVLGGRETQHVGEAEA
jgi:voltage-gated potassium channel